jgi:hypothetical protein
MGQVFCFLLLCAFEETKAIFVGWIFVHPSTAWPWPGFSL